MAMRELTDDELMMVNGGLSFKGWITSIAGSQAAGAAFGGVGAIPGAIAGAIEGYYAGTGAGIVGCALVELFD